jgi:FdrA protein
MSVPAVFGGPVRVLNVGLELFLETLQADGVEVVHVDWRPPAGGDEPGCTLAALDDEADPPGAGPPPS